MARINGVLGPIDTAELGFTLMHEHIFIANASMRLAFERWVDEKAAIDQRVATIAELCRRGYAGRMVLSHDACCHMDFWPQDVLQDALETAAPNWNFRHIPDDVVPALRKADVSEEHIMRMTVDNPRRVFEAQGGY
jgi:phosphotriesterase-related protein